MVGRVGIELGLQAEAPAVGVGRAALSSGTAVQVVPRVELDAGEGGEDLHGDAGGRGGRPGDGPERPRLAVGNPVVVIAPRYGELVEGLVNAFPDFSRAAQVHGGALHRGELPGGNGAGTNRGIVGGAQLDILPLHTAAVVAGQVEITVVGEVADGIPVTLRPIADSQPVLLQAVRHPDGERTGVALLPVGADQRQGDEAVRQPLHRPDLLVKAHGSPVERVGPIVGGQGVLHPVQGKPRPADAVGVPPHQGAHILVLRPVVLQGVEAQRHIHRISVSVWDNQRAHRAAVGDDLAAQPPVFQGKLLYLGPVGHTAKIPSVFLHNPSAPPAIPALLSFCLSLPQLSPENNSITAIFCPKLEFVNGDIVNILEKISAPCWLFFNFLL